MPDPSGGAPVRSCAREPIPNTVTRGAALSLAILYLLLVPAHLVVLSGNARPVMAGLAGVSGLAAVAVAAAARRRDPLPRLVSEGIVLLPVANSLVHLGVSRQVEQSTDLALTLVGIGAYLAGRTVPSLLAGGSLVAWTAIVVLDVRPTAMALVHFSLLLVMACVLGAVLHEARRRRGGQRAATGQALTESERRFRTVFAASPVGVGLSDETGRFVAVNPALCALLGRSQAELLQLPATLLTDPGAYRRGGVLSPASTGSRHRTA